MSLEYYFWTSFYRNESFCLLIIWMACLNVIHRFEEICELMMYQNHCLLAQMFESIMRHVVCGFIIMTLTWMIHCVVLIESWRILKFLHLIGRVALSDVIFVWLISVIIMCRFALLDYLNGWVEICLYELLVSNGWLN